MDQKQVNEDAGPSKKKEKKPAGPKETIDVSVSDKLVVKLTVPPRDQKF